MDSHTPTKTLLQPMCFLLIERGKKLSQRTTAEVRRIYSSAVTKSNGLHFLQKLEGGGGGL